MKRILVPTDGSELSERALPLAESIARSQGADIILARIVELPRWTGVEPEGYVSADIYDDLISALEEEARRSLDALAARCAEAGIAATTQLRQGSPSIGLLDIEADTNPDLVVIGSHGRTGLARFALGSVADRLVREGTAPVLVDRSFGAPPAQLRRALVPLDGSPLAEEALRVVTDLAGKPLVSVDLVRAIATAERQSAATDYLANIAQTLRGLGLQVDTSVRLGDAGQTIEEAASSVDCVIMATHGRGGIDRMRHGSIAEHTTRSVQVPVLLVRATNPPASQATSSARPAAGG